MSVTALHEVCRDHTALDEVVDLFDSQTELGPEHWDRVFAEAWRGLQRDSHSLEAPVERLASRLESEVPGRLDAAKWRPTPQPIELNEEGHHPEVYVG